MRTPQAQVAVTSDIYNHVSHLRDRIMGRALREGFIDQGVVGWRSTQALTYGRDGPDVETCPAKLCPILFMGENPEEDSDEPMES